MYTLNQLVAKLQSIANNHYQIKSFGYGDNWEIEAEGAKNAPVMWANCRSFSVDESSITYNFAILFMDLVNKGEENELEVLSDQALIATDVLALLDKEAESDNFRIVKSNTGEFFTERFDNEWAGVLLELSFEIQFTRNWCEVPSGAITPIGQECEDATLLINGGAFTTVQAGSLFDILLKDALNNTVTPTSVSGSTIVLPNIGSSSVTVENSDASFTATATPPTYVLPDTTYEVYVNGSLQATQTVPTLKNETINITWQ